MLIVNNDHPKVTIDKILAIGLGGPTTHPAQHGSTKVVAAEPCPSHRAQAMCHSMPDMCWPSPDGCSMTLRAVAALQGIFAIFFFLQNPGKKIAKPPLPSPNN